MNKKIRNILFGLFLIPTMYSTFLNTYYPSDKSLSKSQREIELKKNYDYNLNLSIYEKQGLESKIILEILSRYDRDIIWSSRLKILLGDKNIRLTSKLDPRNLNSIRDFLFPQNFEGVSFFNLSSNEFDIPFNLYLKKTAKENQKKFRYVFVHELTHKINDFCNFSNNCNTDFYQAYQKFPVYVNSPFEKTDYSKKNVKEDIAILVSEIYRNYDGISINSTIKNRLKPMNGNSEQLIKKVKLLYSTGINFFPKNFNIQ